MSLTGILNSAISGLNTSQAALLTVATNIANVNTPGFAREKVELETLILGGATAGVRIAEVRRVVDEFLLAELRTVLATEKMFETGDIFHSRLQALFGTPDQNASLSGKIDALFAGFANLPLDPTSVARRVSVINDLKIFADTVTRLAVQIQSLREDADARIASATDAANDAIKEIAELNPLIVTDLVAGNTPNGLMGRRDAAARVLAEILDIDARADRNGFMIVGTTNGIQLVTADVYFLLDYSAQGTVTSSSRFAQIEARKFDKVNGVIGPTGVEINDEIKAGELRALLDMRDTVLPKLGFELAELSGKVQDQLNRIHNENTTIPGPEIMVGRNTGLLGTDAHGFSGITTFAIHNADGTVFANVAVDFSSMGSTVNDMITALKAALNPAADVNFSNGVLTVDAPLLSRTIAVVNDPNNPNTRGGRSFAHFFGLNDLMEAGSQAHFDTGLTGTDLHGFTAGQNVTLQLLSPTSEVALEHVEIISGTTFNDILTSLNDPAAMGSFGTFSLDANGALVFSPVSGFEDYRVNVLSDSTQRGDTGWSLSTLFGIGDSIRMDRAKDVTVKRVVMADPAKLALARVDLSVPAGLSALSVGDPSGALAFQNLQNEKVSFQAAGSLGALTAELAEYAANILGNAGSRANRTEQRLIAAAARRSEIEKRVNEVSGVNLDEELAQMVVLQNAYNASARLIATAQEMLDTLMAVV